MALTDKTLTKYANGKQQPTILVMAGGTGGHIFPGIAVADELSARGWQVHWLGTKQRMEADIIPAHGYDISFINIAGMRNKSFAQLLKLPVKMLLSLWQSIKVIRQINPDVVLGMGGYASAPGGVAAWLNCKPLVLHEQNAVAGMTNRYLSHLATKVLSAFPGAFSRRVEPLVVGNPLRNFFVPTELTTPNEGQSQTSTAKRVLVVGGSLGAQVLNETVPQALKQIKSRDIEVWHQTGKGKIEAVQSSYQAYGLPADKVKICQFIDDIVSAYQWADVVICRAGALTVSELAVMGKTAIFVPLPHAVDDHQTKNAQYLVTKGAAKIIAQQDLNGTTLAQTLNSLFANDSVLATMSKAALAAGNVTATKQVADVCEQLVAKAKNNKATRNNQDE